MDSSGTRLGSADSAAHPLHSARYGTPPPPTHPRRPYLQFPPPPPYPPPDEQEQPLGNSDEEASPPPYDIQESQFRRQGSFGQHSSILSSSLPSHLLNSSTKSVGGKCSYLESDFPYESHCHQVADDFDQFSDFGRSNSPRVHTTVSDLDADCSKNSMLNKSVSPEGAEYSYAYYEPGPPTSHASFMVSNGTSSPHRDRSSRHTYVTRYGTEENIYEEINEVAAKCSQLAEQERFHHHHQQHKQNHQSQVSLNQSVLEEEVRRVQSRHRRVLGELNLTVEAMLMPPPPRKDEENMNNNGMCTSKGAGPPDLLEDLLLSVGPTDELLSPASCSTGDHDSGFSGSSGTSYGFSGSSGTSYNTSVISGSSLRRQSGHRGAGSSPSIPRTVGANVLASAVSAAVYSPLLSRRAFKGGAGYQKCTKSQECAAQQQNKQNQLQQQQNQHHGFFGRKGWIRLPGFGSGHTNKGAGKCRVYILLVGYVGLR